MKNTFQPYATLNKKILEFDRRKEVANQIISVIKDKLKEKDLKKLRCLEIGTSAGVIGKYLSYHFKEVVGIDVDTYAANYWKKNSRKNLKLLLMSAEDIKFKSNSFDVVVTNQDYECIPHQRKFFSEIYRVLKPGGICFLGARNKLAIIEGQYNVPFVGMLPKNIAKNVMSLMGKKNVSIANYQTYWGLKKLCKKFVIDDYTIRIIRHPNTYNFAKLVKYQKYTSLIPTFMLSPLEFAIPNFVWVLQKPRD